ncbi:MAG TPA: hypothetical protein C5S50_00025 [Methanosarcinaceae archaeon]|nr:hypothetical protein [Methanosarcinaceae archaeon]
MIKKFMLTIVFLFFVASSVSAETEYKYVDVNIKVVDLTNEPVSNTWVRIWNDTGGEIVPYSGNTKDGNVTLRIPGVGGPHVIQVFSLAGVDKTQSIGRELAYERRYIFNPSIASDAVYEIVVNEVNGSNGYTVMYKMSNDSLNMAKKSLDISNQSFKLSFAAFVISLIGIISSIGKSFIYKYCEYSVTLHRLLFKKIPK